MTEVSIHENSELSADDAAYFKDVISHFSWGLEGEPDYEHVARILSARLRQMDKQAKAANARAKAANARADAAEAMLATVKACMPGGVYWVPTDAPAMTGNTPEQMQEMQRFQDANPDAFWFNGRWLRPSRQVF